MNQLLLLFGLFSVLHIALALFLPSFIPEASFPYKDLIYKYFSFFPFSPFANFDGYQYLSIAKNGYGEFQQSYFPLFPFIIFLASFVIPQYVLAGVSVSWVFFFLGLVYFKKLIEVLLKDKSQVCWAMLLLLAFPSAFFYQAIYTEGLFLFLMSAALYYLYSKKYRWAVLFAVLASLTKIQGVFLLIPFIISVFGLSLHSLKHVKLHVHPKQIFIALSPLYGLFLYMGYLYVQYKNPLYFYTAQSAFGAQRAVGEIILLPQVLYRYVKIFLNSQINFVYFISALEFVVCLGVVGVVGYELYRLIKKEKAKDMNQISIQIFSLAVFLLPTLTGTLTSVPRYALISIGFFIALANLRSNIFKGIIFAIFLMLHIVLAVFFMKGYFVG